MTMEWEITKDCRCGRRLKARRVWDKQGPYSYKDFEGGEAALVPAWRRPASMKCGGCGRRHRFETFRNFDGGA